MPVSFVTCGDVNGDAARAVGAWQRFAAGYTAGFCSSFLGHPLPCLRAMPHNEKPGRARRHSRTGTGCESTLEQVETRREERKNSATPWILLKSMVLVVFGMHAEPAKPTSLELT